MVTIVPTRVVDDPIERLFWDGYDAAIKAARERCHDRERYAMSHEILRAQSDGSLRMVRTVLPPVTNEGLSE